ncbi:MAG: hypothetical protein AMS27_03575 [Bacteroides sp. SM23_62_1]|nr:MAG: hypothetical protein AMS27_03575 [Bacteroides sp. SM23_62_1]
MADITAIIIYRSDNDDFEKCIKSVHEITDVIVVLDPLKSDKARMICRDKEIDYQTSDAEKIGKDLRKTVEGMKPEYLLFLRSNEYLSGQLKNSLINQRQLLNNDAYRINILKNYYGQWMKHSGLYPDYQVRLLKKQEAHQVIPEIEKIAISGETKTTGVIPGDLYSVIYKNIWEHIQIMNIVTERDAHMLLDKGIKTNIIKIVFHPLAQFLMLFFIKLGFLDGFYGMVNTVISGHTIFLTQVKLRELHRLNRSK